MVAVPVASDFTPIWPAKRTGPGGSYTDLGSTRSTVRPSPETRRRAQLNLAAYALEQPDGAGEPAAWLRDMLEAFGLLERLG